MPGIHADPKEIERFRGQLTKFNNELERMTSQLEGNMRELGNTWQDQQFQKFSNEMTQSIHSFKRYLQSADSTLRELSKKVYHLNEYGGR